MNRAITNIWDKNIHTEYNVKTTIEKGFDEVNLIRKFIRVLFYQERSRIPHENER